MTSIKTAKTAWFKRVLQKYNKFCNELGVDQGSCRGCVPVVKFDPEPNKKGQKKGQ